MSDNLYLIELTTTNTGREAALTLLSAVDTALAGVDAKLIETQAAGDGSRLFVIVQSTDPGTLSDTLAALDGVEEVTEPAAVRLVGAELSDIIAARPEADYLVEWDLPEDLDMDTYLARKKAKSPLYATVPEVSFLRTYVREDMAKCLCFYDAPDVDTVIAARAAVSTPIDRLTTLLGRVGAK